MTQYIGVDLGTSMIKAAGVGNAQDVPSLLPLEPPEFFMPAAVQIGLAGRAGAVGAHAYGNRRLADCTVACEFRDQVVSPGSSLLVGGQSVNGLQLQIALLGELAIRIGTATGGDVAGVGVAVPDHLFEPQWSLPIALARAEWNPNILVREWAAVLAMQGEMTSDEVMMLSMGAGGVQATFCRHRNGQWQKVAHAATNVVSSRLLRESLLNRMSEAVVQAVRKDPREDAAADQAMYNALEQAQRALLIESTTTFAAEVFGQRFSQTLSRDVIAKAAEPLKAPLQQLLKGLLSDGQVDVDNCPIVAWGELSMLLPLSQWVAPFCSTRIPLRIAPLDVVAAGAARLSALSDHLALTSPSTGLAYVDMDQGRYFERQPEADGQEPRLFPVLEGLPTSVVAASGRPVASLVLVTPEGDGQRVGIGQTRFRLGRQKSCNWSFDYDQFPTVSGDHAEITLDGSDYLLADLSSANKTFVNGAEVRKKIPLHDGDLINLGRQGPCLRFEYCNDGELVDSDRP